MNAVISERLLAPAAPQSRPRVVVVDDSRASLGLYRLALESLPIDLELFESPRAGFEYLETHDADLALLGNLMREIDGMTLLKHLRERPRHRNTAVVIASTKDYNQDRAAARDLGALAYLVKPVRSQDLRDVVIRYTRAQVIEP